MKLQNKDYNSYFGYMSTVAGQTASWKRRFLLKKSCHCRVDMVVRMRKVMAMKGRLYECFSAGNWYCYKVVTIAKKFTWSWACHKIRLSADNFKKPTQPGWAQHGCAILVFWLQTPARKCEIINGLPCGEDGWVDEPDVRSRDYQKFLVWTDNQLFSAIRLCSHVELRYQSLTTLYYLSA